MRWSKRRKNFRAILNGKRCIHPGSVADPMTARITQEVGFEVGIFAGSVASMAVLGAPDLILLTLSEFVDQARRISRATELPLLVDADHGYGNALNVRRTVEELEMAGVAALSIEDTELPMPHGSGGNARLISLQEGVGKMQAALNARTDPELVIAGRTSAAGIAGVDEAIKRIIAYENAGVDAVFLVGVKSREDLETIGAEASTPIILGSASREMMNREWLAKVGVRICLQGHKVHAAAINAFLAAQQALADGTHPDDLKNIATDDTMKQLMRVTAYDRWVADYV